MTPDVSIIVPAYNSARFIAETLRTAQAQTGIRSEIILVDGASRDDTVAQARAACPDLKVISEPDRGVSDARNKGLRLAQADWVAFLDADDVWQPDKLARQLAVARSEPDMALVFCDAWQFRGDERLLDSFLATRADFPGLPRHAVPGVDQGQVFDTDMAAAIMRTNFVVTTSTAIAHRERALAVGGFDTTLKVCEDYDFWLRLTKDRRVGVVDAPLVGYRHHGNSLSDDQEAMIRGRIEVAERVFAAPQRYPDGALAFFQGEQARRYAQLGRRAFHSGDLRQARQHLWRSLRSAPNVGTAALLAASCSGRLGSRLLLSAKRTLGLNLDR
jgi:glycosyltransferase involved in cell wall biosynthesis